MPDRLDSCVFPRDFIGKRINPESKKKGAPVHSELCYRCSLPGLTGFAGYCYRSILNV